MRDYALGGCGFPIPWYCETVEEPMIDIEETLCWQCSKTYPIEAEKCPYCGAANGNVDLEKAQAEQLDDFARKMRNSPDPLRKCKHGRVYNGTACPKCRDEVRDTVGQQCRTDGRCQYAIDHGAEGMGHCPEGKCAQPIGLWPIDGDWNNSSLENWFPYTAEELERLRVENANLARALAKEVNGPTFMGEPVLQPIRSTCLRCGADWNNGQIDATYKSCDANGDWHEHSDRVRPAAKRVLEMLEAEGYGSTEPTDALRTALECRECPDGDCSDCPRKPPRWVPQS